MSIGRALHFAARAAVLVVGATLLYVLVTVGQVVWASTRDDHAPAQAIIVLGAAQYDGRPSPVLRGRLDHAVELYSAGVAPTVVVTGGKRVGDRFTEAAASYEYLRRRGIPAFALLREEQGTSTWEQLAASARFLRVRDIREVVLVSDDYHAYRLERIADGLGLDVQVSPVDPGLSLAGRARAIGRETVAVMVGRLIGYRRTVDLEGSFSGVRSLHPVG